MGCNPCDAIGVEARIANSVFPDARSLAQMCRSSPLQPRGFRVFLGYLGRLTRVTGSDAGQDVW